MKQFNGEIAGKKLSDFNNFDSGLSTFKERLKHVQDNIGSEEGDLHEFFQEYVDKYYDSSPSQNGYLADQTTVFNLIERLGTFLIESPDMKTSRKVEYRFWVDERAFNKSRESSNVNETDLGNGTGSEVIDMFVDRKNDKNQKVVRGFTINSRDLKEIEEIRLVEDAINYMKSPKGIEGMKRHAEKILEDGECSPEETVKIRYVAKNTERYINAYVKSLREDQLLIRNMVRRPIVFKNVIPDKPVSNLIDMIEFSDENCVKKLLPLIGGEESLMTDIGIILYDLNQFLKTVKFSDREIAVLDMFRLGYKQKELSVELGIDKRTVSDTITRIATKTAKSYAKVLCEKNNKIN